MAVLSAGPDGPPSELTSFIGRGDLLRTARDRLTASRFLTLTGPPGVGKTRVAAQLLRQERTLGRVALFCDLRTRKTDLDLCMAVGQALEICLGEGLDLEKHVEAVERSLAALGPALIVMDNFEQLSASSAQVLVRWLQRARGARFVVTSRRLLRAVGEAAIEVPPLGLPTHDQDNGAESVCLFEARARDAEPAFVGRGDQCGQIVALVRRLEGIPLAIELAAAQMRRLSPAQLRSQLASSLQLQADHLVESGHRTLRAAIDGSWSLLSEQERSALADLSVFRTPFTFAAAEAVIDRAGSLSSTEASSILEGLRRASLVRMHRDSGEGSEERRWSLFEAIRDYAAERLTDAAADAVHERHAQYYLRWGEQRVAGLTTRAASSARAALVAEVDNLRQAFAHFDGADREGIRDPKSEVARMALVLYEALRRWLPAVAVDVLTRVIQRSDGVACDPTVAARLWIARGASNRELAKYELAAADFEAAEQLLRKRSNLDRTLFAKLDYEVGSLHLELGMHRPAQERLSCALREAIVSRSRHLEGLIRRDLGWAKAEILDPGGFDEYAKAATIFSEAENLAEATAVQVIWCVHRVFFQRGNPIADLERHLSVLRRLRNRWLEGQALNVMAAHRLDEGDSDAALGFCERAIVMAERFHLRRVESAAHAFRGLAFHETGRIDEALLAYERAVHTAAATGNARSEGINRILLAGLLAQQGDPTAAEDAIRNGSCALASIGDTVSLELADLQTAQIDLQRARIAQRKGELSEERLLRDRARGRMIAAQEPRVASGPQLSLAEGSPEARAILRILEREVERDRTLQVREDGGAFRFGAGRWVELPRGPIIRSALAAFAEQRLQSPGGHLSIEALFARCWPGERVVGESGLRRVRQVVKRLRRAGLEEVLLTAEAGYLIDRSVPFRIDSAQRP